MPNHFYDEEEEHCIENTIEFCTIYNIRTELCDKCDDEHYLTHGHCCTKK